MNAVMMDVLEEHLDEAAFLSSQWERALIDAHLGLAHTAEREARLLAHVDGLVVGGVPATQALLLPALETEEAMRVFAAAFSLLAGTGGLEETLAVLDGGHAVQRAGVARALELSAREGLDAALRQRLSSNEVGLRALAFQVLAFRGVAPMQTRVEWLGHEDARLVMAALGDSRPLARDVGQGVLTRLLVDPRPGVREAALQAGLVSAPAARDAWRACRKVAEEGGLARRQCLLVLALGGEQGDAEWLVGLARDKALRADALWALGFSGHVNAAEACLEWMDDANVAALAGEAFCAITGLELGEPYQQDAPAEQEALIPLEQEDLDANLVPGPEAHLPVPLREAVERWWREARKDFERGTRYLRGSKWGPGELLDALEREPMRRRHALALELAIRSRGAHLLQTRAFTRRQRAELAAARAATSSLSSSPFTKLFGA
jgi:uncharacterized protein (TIGR02270 family)